MKTKMQTNVTHLIFAAECKNTLNFPALNLDFRNFKRFFPVTYPIIYNSLIQSAQKKKTMRTNIHGTVKSPFDLLRQNAPAPHNIV